jgi:hypothetical protein
LLDRQPPKQSRKARWRERVEAGLMVAPPPVSHRVIDMLIVRGWLAQAGAGDRFAVGRGLAAANELTMNGG